MKTAIVETTGTYGKYNNNQQLEQIQNTRRREATQRSGHRTMMLERRSPNEWIKRG